MQYLKKTSRPILGTIRRRVSKSIGFVFVVSTAMVITACYYQPYTAGAPYQPAPAAQTQDIPSTQIHFYPKQGQSTDRQSRDHYECYNWAIQQTGFDPGDMPISKENRVRVVPMPPPGYDTAAFAIAGAVLGALIGGPRHGLEGAFLGATGGAIAGAASDTARQQQAQQIEEAQAAQQQAKDRRISNRVLDFRRAMSACLEGRGYTVK